MQRVILHCDLNNFYATVEALRNPELLGKPVAVCGDPAKRHGIVLAKSEEAKKCGVKTGDVIWEAKQKCPNLIIVATNHGDYSKYAKLVRDIYYRYTDKVEAYGSDECWLDVTHSLKLLGKSGKEIADELRKVVKDELGLTISVGVSFTKTFAKLGSDYKKPDATTEITKENFREIVWSMPVTNLLYVGRKSRALFEKLNIRTIGDLAAFDVAALRSHIGITADQLIASARGEEADEVASYDDRRIVKSVGNGTTVPRDLVDFKEAHKVMYLLCEEVAWRMRKKGLKGFTVNLSIKDYELKWVGAQESIKEATNSVRTILEVAENIFHKLWDKEPIRALRVAVSNLTTDTRVQLSLFHDGAAEDKNDKLSAVFDKVRKKYGTKAITQASLLGSDFDLEFEVVDESY
jgi:DNA polymerase-4